MTLTIVARGRVTSATWAPVPDLTDIPAEVRGEIEAQVARLNRAVGWPKYQVRENLTSIQGCLDA